MKFNCTDEGVVLSIIVYGETDEESVRNLCSQSLRNMEIVGVNLSYDIQSTIPYISLKSDLNTQESLLEAVKKASGKYIAFFSKSGEVSFDYYRLLVENIDNNESDIVVGQYAIADGNDKYYYNLDPNRHRKALCGDGANLDYIMSFEGTPRSVFSINNKIFAKNITICSLEEICECESDSLGSFIDHALLISTCGRSNKTTFVNGNSYYFDKKEEIKIKYPEIIQQSKLFFELLEKKPTLNKYKLNILNWKYKVGVFLCQDARVRSPEDVSNICSVFRVKTYEAVNNIDNHFYSVRTKLSDLYYAQERSKRTIADPYCKYVSFDLFDTLVCRPFIDPKDLFSFMNEDFRKCLRTTSFIDFKVARVIAEDEARKKHDYKKEITLDEIYEQLSKTYGLTLEQCEELKNKEKKLEMRFCNIRKSTYEFYTLSRYCCKKIIITTDMYLPMETISAILEKNEIADCEIYLSSDKRVTKDTGEMYDLILKDKKGENLKPDQFCHLGDNWFSDFVNSQKHGFNAIHINNKDTFLRGDNPSFPTGDFFKNIYVKTNTYYDGSYTLNNFHDLRCLLGLVSSKIFDESFISFDQDSDFNADPYYVGYCCLGMQLLATVRWILNKVDKNTHTIHFVARDGWMVKHAYDLYTEGMKNVPESNYIYVSRNALLTTDMNCINDLYSLPDGKLVCEKLNISSLLKKLRIVIKEERYDELVSEYKYSRHFASEFGSRVEFYEFVNDIKSRFEDAFDFETNKQKLRSYFNEIIKGDDILFDIGYSGRAESTLSMLLERPVNSLYYHTKSEILRQREEIAGFKNESLMNWCPNITGVIREHLLMELAPSTIGYSLDNNEVKPVFEEDHLNVPTRIVTEDIQSASLDFIKDVISTFGYDLNVRDIDLVFPSEYFYTNAKNDDKKILSCLIFEDALGTGSSFNAYDFWRKDQERVVWNLYVPTAPWNIPTSPLMIPIQMASGKGKILLYSNEYSWSGGPKAVLNICKCLRTLGYDVDVWADKDTEDGFRAHMEELGFTAEVHPVDFINRYEADRYDLCIVNTVIPYKAYDIISKETKTIWYLHEGQNIEMFVRGEPDMKGVLEKAYGVFCVSEYAKSYIDPYLKKPARVLMNCVEDIHPVRKNQREKIVFLMLGTIEKRKGLDVCLSAFALLHKSYKDKIEFRFAGRLLGEKTSIEFAKEQLSRAKNLKNVSYLGVLTSESELNNAYSEADVLIVSSRDESCSLTALEGAMHSMPLIVTENTGAKYLVDNTNGAIVKTGNVRSLTKAIMSIADSYERIPDMGNVSRKRYEETSTAEVFMESLKKIVECELAPGKAPVLEHPSEITYIDKQPEEASAFSNVVPIIMASNDNYAPFALVTAESIIENGNSDTYYDMYLLHAGLPDNTKSKLDSFKGNNYRLMCVDVSGLIANDLPLLKTRVHISIETYFRFYIPEVIKAYDKVLYLDCDIIVLSDVKELFSTKIGENIIGASPDFLNPEVCNYVSESLGLQPRDYINAGMLVFNVRSFADHNCKERAMNLLSERKLLMMDQDAINLVCAGYISRINPEWNVQWHRLLDGSVMDYQKDIFAQVCAKPKIIHYTSKIKPWDCPDKPLADKFWHYASKSIAYNEILTRISSNKVDKTLSESKDGKTNKKWSDFFNRSHRKKEFM